MFHMDFPDFSSFPYSVHEKRNIRCIIEQIFKRELIFLKHFTFRSSSDARRFRRRRPFVNIYVRIRYDNRKSQQIFYFMSENKSFNSV
jgi:hypothetical protein